MSSWALALVVVVPLGTAALGLVGIATPRLQGLLAVAGAAIHAVIAAILFQAVSDQGLVALQASNWPAPFGITLVADTLSAVLVMLAALVGLAVAIHAVAELGRPVFAAGFVPMFNVLLAGVCGAFVTGDIFNLYVWFEVLLIASFGLLSVGGQRPQFDATVRYVALNLFATTVFLIATGLLYGLTGTLNLADLGRVLPATDAGVRGAVFAMFIMALAMKAAAFPVFFWLPASYHTPSFSTAAIFAGLVTKVGAYALIRLTTQAFAADGALAAAIIGPLAAATMLIGALGALVQHDLRRILAFNLISGIGFILMGLSVGSALALAGGIFYTAHHIIAMTALFLLAGLIVAASGTSDLRTMGGLYAQRPLLAALFFVAALALAGLPPFSGFWAKVMLIRASLEVGQNWLAAVALVAGLLTLLSMGQVWAGAFWRKAPGTATAAAAGAGRMVPTALLVAALVALGLFAQPAVELAQRAASQLQEADAVATRILGQGTP